VSIASLAERHRSAIYVAVAFITLAGLYAMFTLPAGIYPEVTYPRIAVIAEGGTFEARAMVVAVTRPLEEAMSGIIDLRLIRSKTVRGASELSLDFRPQADMQFALQQVQARVAEVLPSLPPDIDVRAERLTPSVFPIIQYILTGADPMVLRDLAQYVIRPRLARIPDVGEVEVQGGDVREVAVVLAPEKLLATQVTVEDVANAIQSQNVDVAAGRIDRQYRQYSVILSGIATTPAAVGDIVVRRTGDRVVHVADLGTVRYGAADKFEIATGNGEAAALVNIARQPRGNSLKIQRAVHEAVRDLRPLLPAGVKMISVYDQAELVHQSIGSVRDAILVGGLLAVIVLLIFLGNIRLTVAAGLSLPLSLAGTFLGLALARESLNLMSLGGLAVAIGLIIDDAVVVVENIERRLAHSSDRSPTAVIREATDEIFGPVFGSTITTVVVFSPLGLLQGVVGEFFRSFSIALSVAVLLSLLLAMTLIPALAVQWAERRRARGGVATAGRAHGLSLRPVESRYRRIERRFLDRRRFALGVGALLIVLAFGLSRVIGTGFLPEMDEGGFILDYITPTGTALSETNRELSAIEHILRNDPAVAGFSRRTGSELGFAATAPNTGDMTVLLKPRRKRHVSVYEVMDRVRAQIETEVPGIHVEFIQLLQDVIGDLAGAPAPVEIKLFSPDRPAAERTALEVAERVEKIPGLVDLYNGVPGPNPEVKVTLDPARTARLGLTVGEVETQARAALFGADAGAAREPDRLVPIRARLPDEARFDPRVASLLPITGPSGTAPLGTLGTVRDTADASELLRENLRDVVKVTGGVSGAPLGTVMKRIRHALADLALPADVTVEYGGQYASQRESFGQLLLVMALAVGAVLLVLVIQFRNVRAPLVLMIAAVLGLTGAFLGLAVTGVPFNVSSFMGLILLIGLIVKNGIILFDAAQRFRAEGRTPHDALLEAGTLRLRPILMTTLCTVVGLFPLALGWGAGAELQRPLAIAVIGGLSLSTLVTLLLVPVGLDVVGALKEDKARGKADAAPGSNA
jgi:CzcA family heavy metal efflux pump